MDRTIILADSGSTKTNWMVMHANGSPSRCIKTDGINPFMQETDAIRTMLADCLLPRLEGAELQPAAIHFYGAGCTPEKIPEMCGVLRTLFPATATVEVASDMVGAARSLCGHQPGVACILGTGSNSCLYNGREIVRQISPLGFILGDEGSGAVLGKRLVGDLLKEQLEEGLKEAFLEQYGLTPADIIRKVYREPYPNRFLASLVPFLDAHKAVPGIQALLHSCFTDFFRRNVLPYGKPDIPVHIIGGLTIPFQEEIAQAARTCGLHPGKLVSDPIEGLMEYHKDLKDPLGPPA